MQSSSDLAKPTSPPISKTITYFASFVALGLTTASMGPTLQGLAAHTGATISQASFLFTARALGYLVGSLGGGRGYDRFPGHRVQAGALLLVAAMLALVPILPSLWLLAAILVVLGIGEGTVDVGGNTMLMWVHGEKVSPFMNALHFFFGIGSFLAPVIVAQSLLISQDVSLAYFALAVLMLPVVVGLLRQPSPAIPRHTQGAQGGVVPALTLALFILFFFFIVGAEGSFGGWIFTYTQAQGVGNQTTAAYVNSAFWAAFTAGRLIAIPISTRVQPRWILLGNLLGCLASIGVILIWQGAEAVVWAGSLGFGLFMASAFPTTLNLAQRYLPISGRVTGWFFVGASLGSMFFPWLIGQLFEPVGPQVSMVLILAACFGALAAYAGLMLRFRGQMARSSEAA